MHRPPDRETLLSALEVFFFMIIFLSFLVALAGLLIYAFATNGKLVEIGRITYFAGLLAFLLQIPAQMVSLLGHVH